MRVPLYIKKYGLILKGQKRFNETNFYQLIDAEGCKQ